MWRLGNGLIKTPWHGIQTTLYCSLDDNIEDKSGCYFSDCAVKQPHKYGRSAEDARKLWEVSAEMVGCPVDI